MMGMDRIDILSPSRVHLPPMISKVDLHSKILELGAIAFVMVGL